MSRRATPSLFLAPNGPVSARIDPGILTDVAGLVLLAVGPGLAEDSAAGHHPGVAYRVFRLYA
jgi:hypothetical protein